MADVDPALVQQVFAFLCDSEYFTYIITTRRITSGDELKYWNGLRAGTAAS